MSRIRLNQEYRNKIGNRMKIHLEQEDTQEKKVYDTLKADQIELNDNSWEVAHSIVRRHYTPEDIVKARYLQDKFENVDTIQPDSCFHFGYQGQVEDRDDNDKPITKDKYIESHFDFRLSGSVEDNSNSYNKDNEYAFALFRDELKAQDNCNPDIFIEQKDKDDNPHKRKFVDNNDKYLGLSGGNDNETRYGKEWNDKYKLDLIGREYCRDRSIACTKDEYAFLISWKTAKQKFIMAHYKWVESILSQMKEIKIGLKGYKYLDEAIELCTELGLSVDDAEIIRCNSGGLVIYNPKNLAERIKGMKNKEKTRDQKIAERKLYLQNAQSSVVN